MTGFLLLPLHGDPPVSAAAAQLVLRHRRPGSSLPLRHTPHLIKLYLDITSCAKGPTGAAHPTLPLSPAEVLDAAVLVVPQGTPVPVERHPASLKIVWQSLDQEKIMQRSCKDRLAKS